MTSQKTDATDSVNYDRKGLVFYYNWIEGLEGLDDATQLFIIKAIFRYDMTGEETPHSNPLINALMRQYYQELDIQADNWTKKTKRPARYDLGEFVPLFAEGWTNEDIVKKIGCSLRTVQRKRKEFNELNDSPYENENE